MTSQMLKSARHIGFFLAGGPVGEGVGVGNGVSSNLKRRLDHEKRFTPISGSHGHPGDENRLFSYAGRESFVGRNPDCPDGEN